MSNSYTANLLNAAHTKWRELKCRRATLKNDLANLDEEIDYLQALMRMATSQYGPMDELLPILEAASGIFSAIATPMGSGSTVVQNPDEECGVEDSPSGYVIRTHSVVNPDAILGFVAMEGELGTSLGHLARKVYVSVCAAVGDAAKYNRLNPSLCFAVVIPNGTEEECLTADPIWK